MEIPKWLLIQEKITTRQWKARKREELKAVIKAFDDYRLGCAYCPSADSAVGRISNALKELKIELSIKKWGR